MLQPLNRFLLLQPVWLPTVLFIPLLYALGWLAAVPLTLLWPANGSALSHRNGAEFCAVPPGYAPMGSLAVVRTTALGGLVGELPAHSPLGRSAAARAGLLEGGFHGAAADRE